MSIRGMDRFKGDPENGWRLAELQVYVARLREGYLKLIPMK